MRVHNTYHSRKARAALRQQMTPAEIRLWSLLRRNQLEGRKFRRQHSVGPYILDFYCASEQLAVELDGEGHQSDAGYLYDQRRGAYLLSQGIRTLRFENKLVFQEPDALLAAIKTAFADESKDPSDP